MFTFSRDSTTHKRVGCDHFISLVAPITGDRTATHLQEIEPRSSVSPPLYHNYKPLHFKCSLNVGNALFILRYSGCNGLHGPVLGRLIITQIVKKFPIVYGARRFITMFTKACHRSLSWATRIQSTPSHTTSL